MGHGLPAWIGASSSGGGLLSQVPSCEGAWILKSFGALEIVAGGHMAASLGLGFMAILALNLLVGATLFLFL